MEAGAPSPRTAGGSRSRARQPRREGVAVAVAGCLSEGPHIECVEVEPGRRRPKSDPVANPGRACHANLDRATIVPRRA